MSEPKARAKRVDEVVPGVLHWTVKDDRIGGVRSDAYAVVAPEGAVLIDPLPLEPAALERIGTISAICLTGGNHQRSSWSLRKESGARVIAPRNAYRLDDEPDAWYGDPRDAALPGGLEPIELDGFGAPVYALRLKQPGGGDVLFVSDLFLRRDRGDFSLAPDEYVEDPAKIRACAKKIIGLTFETVCPAHGAPEVAGGSLALRRAVEKLEGA